MRLASRNSLLYSFILAACIIVCVLYQRPFSPAGHNNALQLLQKAGDESTPAQEDRQNKANEVLEFPSEPAVGSTENLQEFPPLPAIYAKDFEDLQLPSVLRTPQHARLASRLYTFLTRPILSHAQAAAQNERGCPLRISDKLVNPDQLNGDGSFWREEVDESMIAHKRGDLVAWLAEKASEGETILGGPQVEDGTKGIVVTGGNQDTTLRTLTLLRVLRKLNVTLPIEVVHFKGEMTDDSHRREVEELGGKLVEIRDVSKIDGVWKNFQIKGLAITQSSFDQVLYLDSDNLPLRDPTHLFDAEIYRRNGRAAFWPDLSKDHAHNAIWRVVGEDCTFDHFTFESGQIVIDKRGNGGLNLAALWIASGMMDDTGFWFKLCGGDKDTFKWAFKILGIAFGTAPRWMAPLGIIDRGRFCGHTMLQYDLVTPVNFTEAPPLFVHSNLLKHLGSWGLGRGKAFTHMKKMNIDKYSEATLNFAHLWVHWDNPRGMCTDLDLHDTAQESLSAEDLAWQKAVLVPLSEVEGDPFSQFEELFWDSGGRIGGW